MTKKMKPKPVVPTESPVKIDSLFGYSKKVDPMLASLFAIRTPSQPVQTPNPKSKGVIVRSKASKKVEKSDSAQEEDESSDHSDDDNRGASSESDEELSEGNEHSELAVVKVATDAAPTATQLGEQATIEISAKSRRKRKRDDEDLESKYMQKLAQEEEREESRLAQERRSKRKNASENPESDELKINDEDGDAEAQDEDMVDAESEDEEEGYQIPQHESVSSSQTPEVEKANRTVFLGNVSSDTVTSKTAKKTLLKHMSSILEALPKDKTGHKIESMRFRSTAYTNMLPKKASFVTQDLMDSTTKSTNAYIVYTTKTAAREALKLNGSVVLGRHLRVDSVAHPSKTDPRRCVFVGNLGFVDDESAIQAAEAEAGEKKKKKPRKQKPSDVEEGLWREFGKCGTVENVRVVRDPKTRVGKGFAYVQFVDENAVEAALLYNDKKFPPLLPRKLRVSRAKGMKRNATKKDTCARPAANGVYNPKVSGQQKSALGRASKLLGRAGAALLNRPLPDASGGAKPGDVTGGERTLKAPEDFVFEGHRATPGSHVSKKKRVASPKQGKKGKPNNRSTRRATAWKTGRA